MPEQYFLHNMSAPPRSKVEIAPHRKEKQTLVFSLKEFALTPTSWETQLLQQFSVNSLNELQRLADQELEKTSPPLIIPVFESFEFQTMSNLLSVALLSRTFGKLFMLNRAPVLNYERLSKQFTISEPTYIASVLSLYGR